MSFKNDIQVCILFHNKVEQTIEAIESLKSSQIQILILNNHSSVNQSLSLNKYISNHPNIQIFNSDSNLGVSKGRNFLVKKSKSPWLLFIDNDIRVNTINWLDIIRKEIQLNPRIEVFVPKLFNKHENRYSRLVKFEIKNNKLMYHTLLSRYSNNFPGGAAFVSKKLFSRIGKYNEKMFVGFEDFELALRALVKSQPIKVKLINNIELIHDHRFTSDKANKNSVKIRYDYKKISDSHKVISDLYGINIDSNFKPWLDEQKRQMIGESKIIKFARSVKNRLKIILKRILKPIHRSY